jgi:hypothetical protein
VGNNRFLEYQPMKSNAWMAATATALFIGAGLTSGVQAATNAPEVTIPFANRDGIRNWNVLDDHGIWIQGNGNKWYYASFASPCTGLRFETTVGFVPGPDGALDRWSALETHSTGRCRFKSLTASDTPPPASGKPAAEAIKAAPKG